MALPPLGQLSSVQELRISKMERLQKLDAGFYGNSHMRVKPFRCLKTLCFEDLPNWVHWIPSTNEGEEFPSLQELQIQGCPEVIGSLPKHLGSLTKLVVSGCRKLKASIPRVPTLKEMKLHCLDALTTLPEELLGGNSCFQQLEIVNCPSLVSFFGGDFLTTLKSLSISYCRKLEFFQPENVMHQFGVLERLHISNSCESLQDMVLTFVQEIKIKDCLELESLPGGGLHTCLPCLLRLELSNCPKLSQFSQSNLPLNLQSLIISNCNNLTPQKEWGLHGMVSLTCFEIEGGCNNVKFFPEECLLPNTLTSLRISRLPNLRVLDIGLQGFTSLVTLEINDCEKLESMPAGGLPTTLTSLLITECLLLGPCCQEGGVERAKISHISGIHIFRIPDQVNEH